MSFAGRRRGNKVKKGVQFTLMVVGASGTGRTTFVNTLCESEVLAHKISDNPDTAHVEEGIRIKPANVELEEDGVRIALTIVDTPGFGDNIDNEFAFQEIVGYLERQYDDILAEESRIKRNPRFRDNRIHALLYFIPPTGHSLREMDIELMRRLSPRVNVIPVIGKADSLTPSELRGFKKRIMEDIEHYDIPVYNFPYDVEEDDEETIQDNSELRALLPFAIIGSEEEIEIDGQPVRARIYPWGIAEVDNPKHSDFSRLRSALLNSHLGDLKSLTHDVLYETYRTEKLSRTVHSDTNESSILPEELANQSVRLKEEQLRREEEKLREIELKVQREINEKRQELLAKEESLRNLESRLAAQGSQSGLCIQGDDPPTIEPIRGHFLIIFGEEVGTPEMELEWESRTPMPHQPSREWQERPLNAGGPPSSSIPPSAFASGSSTFSQRRRSSAAHRPAGPPPNLPIPNVPATTHSSQYDPSLDSPDETQVNINGRGIHASSLIRPSPSPSLAAVVSFPQTSSFHAPPLASDPLVVDLSDPPPPSILPPSSSRISERNQEIPNHLQAPRDSRGEPRVPSSRRALTRALELARQAVQLDSMNDNPEAAVQAYGRSVALLSEVMERVRRGEDSTESSHRRRRRRSVAAQEEEIRRLQNIHDTYADRMNILSIIYSIPTVPYSSSTMFAALSQTAPSSSPTTSTSPSSDSSPQIPQGTAAPPDLQNHYLVNEDSGHDRDFDSTDALNSAMFALDDTNYTATLISGLPYTSHHPYAVSPESPLEPSVPVVNRQPTLSRRTRSSSNLPPPPPPPSNSLPPAPTSAEIEVDPLPQRNLDARTRQRGESVGQSSAGSGLQALTEEFDDARLDSQQALTELSGADSQHFVLDTPHNVQRDSPPLPPLPSPSTSPETPRVPIPPPPPRSPRLSHIVAPRPRGSSQLTTRSEFAAQPQITQSTAQGTLFQRRTNKNSAPPTPRSSSPADSIVSAGSAPKSTPSSLPGATPLGLPTGRPRSSSQPGRYPSIGGRISPLDQPRPPLPGTASVNGSGIRKTSIPSKLNPNSQPVQLSVQTDLSPAPVGSVSLGPPPQALSSNLPTTPTSPLPPAPPDDPLLKPYHLMNLLRNTMTSSTGGYVTRRLHVPHEVWSQGGAKLSNILEKVRVVAILCSALEDLQASSAEHFGAGNVCSGLALGIGSIGRKEADAWLSKLEEFSSICDGVVTNFGKKLGVGEGFVLRKTTWGGKLTRGFDKITNGKNLDSPAAYVRGLEKLFLHAQLLDEHTQAVLSKPVVPAYAAFPVDIRISTEQRLKRASDFFASVVLTFVIRDLSQLLDKYAKKCEKWLAE
ncbi:hypothetical protein DXG01_000043 [Tephrocybe rancida]|nr:hypothetical protein DXG01_000043 [Tephrocybe rancida]